jgi:PAS domain-containing protein
MNAKSVLRSNAFPLLLSFICLLPSFFWHGQLRISICTAIIVFTIIRISASMRNRRTEQIRKLSLIARNATNSMIILDGKGRIEWVNQPFTLLTGYELEEVIGKRPQEFLHGPQTSHATRREIHACITTGKPFAGRDRQLS